MKRLIALPLIILLFISKQSSAWGPEGHAIVGQIALQFLKPDVKQNVLKILDTMSIHTATNWMDIMKSNSDYDFMRSWHYVDFDKGKNYQASNNENILNKLEDSFRELKHRNTLSGEQEKFDLLVLFHLMGDLHMPLHTGYDEDLGGNKRPVQYDTMKTHNLHRFWDEDIIRLTNINFVDVLASHNKLTDTASSIDFMSWMIDTRSHLDEVYNFPEFNISDQYLQKNKAVVERQLLIGGLRLAAILNKLFYTPATQASASSFTANYKNGIDIKDVSKYVGKEVTVCSKVFGIKTTQGGVTFINVGDKYPNSPLTIVIPAKEKDNFKFSLEDTYTNRNICVKGTIAEYKGKVEIVVDKPENIEVQ